MLGITSSCNRHRSVTGLLPDAFFCKGSALFSALFSAALSLGVPCRRAAVPWTETVATLERSRAPRADPAAARVAVLRILLVGTPVLWFCIKYPSRTGCFWGLGHFLLPCAQTVAQNREVFLLAFPYACIALARVQRQEECNFRNTGVCLGTDEGFFHLLPSVTGDNQHCCIAYCDCT